MFLLIFRICCPKSFYVNSKYLPTILQRPCYHNLSRSITNRKQFTECPTGQIVKYKLNNKNKKPVKYVKHLRNPYRIFVCNTHRCEASHTSLRYFKYQLANTQLLYIVSVLLDYRSNRQQTHSSAQTSFCRHRQRHSRCIACNRIVSGRARKLTAQYFRVNDNIDSRRRNRISR